jgi:hypothetical protein
LRGCVEIRYSHQKETPSGPFLSGSETAGTSDDADGEEMGLAGSATGSRAPVRWIREAADAGLDEDWTLVLLAAAVIVVTIGLAVLAAWTVHQREAALADAVAAGQRLDAGGLDDRLYQDLITMQRDEVALFQDRSDPGQAPPGRDPRADLTRVESDLAALSAQFGTFPRVRRDISLISREMARYTSLEATAQAENQQGLPVGAAYLREASGYLTAYTLPAADDIRLADQARVSADDSLAAGLPWALLIAAVAGLGCLAGTQVVMARYTRCQFDPWLILSTAVTTIVIVWSVTAVSVSLDAAGSDTAPHATEAAALAQARVDGAQAQNYDLLTLADHGEDCVVFGTAAGRVQRVTCKFETQVIRSLSASEGGLRADLSLATADAPDPPARAQAGAAARAVATWLSDEKALPTLQNLWARASKLASPENARYSPSFDNSLLPYANPVKSRDAAGITGDAARFQGAATSAIENEWTSYDRQSAAASDALTGAVPGLVLLGLLAAAAGGAGVGLRVAEYWSAGGRA